jgi:hypothetical protein
MTEESRPDSTQTLNKNIYFTMKNLVINIENCFWMQVLTSQLNDCLFSASDY